MISGPSFEVLSYFNLGHFCFYSEVESVYGEINCWCYSTHMEASEARGVCLKLTDVQLKKISFSVSDSVLLMLVLNGMPLFRFFLFVCLLNNNCNPFRKPISSEFLFPQSKLFFLDHGRESRRRCQLCRLVSCTTSAPTGSH